MKKNTLKFNINTKIENITYKFFPNTETVCKMLCRLRSHKSAVSQSENEEPAPSTSTGEQRTFETLSSRLLYN